MYYGKGSCKHSQSVVPLTIACLVLMVLFGCVRVKVPPFGQATQDGYRLLMVYGRGPSAPQESDSDHEQHWMTVHVTQSDSTFEFGHIPQDGGFDAYCAGAEGRFRIQGGEVRHFAIRQPDDESAIYPLEEFGWYELTGPAMSPTRAVFPPMEKPYYSIAILNFTVSPVDTVMVELLASSPNGFGQPADRIMEPATGAAPSRGR